MNNKMRNTMMIGTISAIAGYTMYRQAKNRSMTPLNRAKNMISKTTNMF